MKNSTAYESYWNQLINFIDSNSHMSLEDLWDSLNYWDLGPSPERFYEIGEARNIPRISIKYGKEETSNLYNITLEKKQFITELILPQIDNNTDAIIEIGGGWGRNIFALYMNLSETYPNIDFIMGEVTTSGRNICSLISKKYDLPINSTYFNYYDWEPIIELIKTKNYKNICVFSNHSIEQIPYLEEKMFDDFLNLNFESLKFTHIEPIGFQLEGGNPSYTGNPEYNQNLNPILTKLEKENKINVMKSIPDYFAFGGGWGNCSSLIQWEKLYLNKDEQEL